MTSSDFSHCSGSDFGVRFPGRRDPHLCGLTSSFNAVNGFGDILMIEIRRLMRFSRSLAKVEDFDIGCAQVATLCKGFSRACDLTKRGMCQSNAGERDLTVRRMARS